MQAPHVCTPLMLVQILYLESSLPLSKQVLVLCEDSVWSGVWFGLLHCPCCAGVDSQVLGAAELQRMRQELQCG